jgi:hypothetical protein
MMRRNRRFQASLESLEAKKLLSNVPVLTSYTYNQVLHQIDRAAGTYAKNHSAAAFDAALSSLSFRIPYGHKQLYPTWQSDEAIYSPAVPGSGLAMVARIKADFRTYVVNQVNSGHIRFR